MDLLGEIYTEHNLKNTERLQLNNLVLRILNNSTTEDEKRILQSTSADKTAIYIKAFQRNMGLRDTGVIEDRAAFKRGVSTLLWRYEKPYTRRTNYSIPFRHFQVPRTREDLDALICSIYPFACKFSAESIKRDTYAGNPYINDKYKLESVDTSASFYDCLVHSFLMSMSSPYRKLSDNQRTAFAYYFRRVVCPRYIKIDDMIHSALYKQRATLSLTPSNAARIAQMTALRVSLEKNEILQDAAIAEPKKLFIEAIQLAEKQKFEEELARLYIKEFEFLDDSHAKLFSNAFHINIIILRELPGLGLSMFPIKPNLQEPPPTHTLVFYNPGDGHFRAVRRTTDSKFYFTNEEIQDFLNEEAERQLANVPKTRCAYAIGEVVLHNGVETTVTEHIWASESDAEGYMNCAFVKLENEATAVPIAEIRKKTSGGKRSTRKQRRIFLKT
jgi:hypothetical protein